MFALSLSACSSGISNAQLEKDVLSLPETITEISKVIDMTIIEKTQSNSSMIYKLSANLKAYDYELSTDIILTYTKTNGKWAVSSYKYDIIQVRPTSDPSLAGAVGLALTGVNNEEDFGHTLIPAYTLVSISEISQDATATMIISSSFDDGLYSGNTLYTVEASFIVKTGWTYKVTDFVYHETMKWAGNYEIEWTQDVPGYPAGGLNTFYKVGTKVTDIVITGECSQMRKMDKTEEFTNTLKITMTYNGTEYTIVPSVNSMAWQMNLSPNSNYDSPIYITYEAVVKNFGQAAQYHVYSVEAPSITGTLTKLP